MNKYHLYRSTAKLSYFHKINNILASNYLIVNLADLKPEEGNGSIKAVLRRYFNTHAFHSVDELLLCKNNS